MTHTICFWNFFFFDIRHLNTVSLYIAYKWLQSLFYFRLHLSKEFQEQTSDGMCISNDYVISQQRWHIDLVEHNEPCPWQQPSSFRFVFFFFYSFYYWTTLLTDVLHFLVWFHSLFMGWFSGVHLFTCSGLICRRFGLGQTLFYSLSTWKGFSFLNLIKDGKRHLRERLVSVFLVNVSDRSAYILSQQPVSYVNAITRNRASGSREVEAT
jgi:hypothetical protein